MGSNKHRMSLQEEVADREHNPGDNERTEMAKLIGKKFPTVDELDVLAIRAQRKKEESRNVTLEALNHGPFCYGTVTFQDGMYTGKHKWGCVPHGKGRFTSLSGEWYDGEWLNGDKFGFATHHLPNGDQYEGEYVKGKKQGFGKYTWADGSFYEGDWVDDCGTGFGRLFARDGSMVVGSFVDCVTAGTACKTWPDGQQKYDGMFRDGLPSGQGTQVFADGAVYTGQFEKGRRHGFGKFEYPNGDKFEGEFRDGKKHGPGKYIFANGDVYEGKYNQNKKEGRGVLKHQNGRTVTGVFHRGMKEGLLQYSSEHEPELGSRRAVRPWKYELPSDQKEGVVSPNLFNSGNFKAPFVSQDGNNRFDELVGPRAGRPRKAPLGRPRTTPQ